MKVRQGFVSNSSSSSFIVSFPLGFEITAENIRNYLFKGQESIYAYSEPISVSDAVGVIMRDMLNQKKSDIYKKPKEWQERNTTILCLLEEEHGDAPSIEDFRVDDNRLYDIPAYRAACEKYVAEAGYNPLVEDIYVFEYADEDGRFYSTMEHGNIFGKVKHDTFSHH
jgi:hypothetical protein